MSFLISAGGCENTFPETNTGQTLVSIVKVSHLRGYKHKTSLWVEKVCKLLYSIFFLFIYFAIIMFPLYAGPLLFFDHWWWRINKLNLHCFYVRMRCLSLQWGHCILCPMHYLHSRHIRRGSLWEKLLHGECFSAFYLNIVLKRGLTCCTALSTRWTCCTEEKLAQWPKHMVYRITQKCIGDQNIA